MTKPQEATSNDQSEVQNDNAFVEDSEANSKMTRVRRPEPPPGSSMSFQEPDGSWKF